MTRPAVPAANLLPTLAMLALLGACGPSSGDAPATHDGLRVVTLAPHLTELVFSAGAGDTLVGVSAYSDYPADAASLPVVGDAFTVDQEKLALLAPDLVLAWQSGTPVRVTDELQKLGYRVAVIRTRGLADIASAIVRIGELTGRSEHATEVAGNFNDGIEGLRSRNSAKASVSVFFQVSAKPLYTVNGRHYIGEIIELCGGHNIFSDLDELAPAVTVESVVERNPDAMFAGSADGTHPFDEWQRWPHIDANRYGNHFVVNSDEIGRPTTRLVAAAASVCEKLDIARVNRSRPSH